MGPSQCPQSEDFQIACRQVKVAEDHYSGRANLQVAVELAAELPLDRLEVLDKLYQHSIANRRGGELLKRNLNWYTSRPEFLRLVNIAYRQQKLAGDGYIILPQVELAKLLPPVPPALLSAIPDYGLLVVYVRG